MLTVVASDDLVGHLVAARNHPERGPLWWGFERRRRGSGGEVRREVEAGVLTITAL